MDNGGAAFFFFFVILIIIWIFALSGCVRERRAMIILGYQPVVENLDKFAIKNGSNHNARDSNTSLLGVKKYDTTSEIDTKETAKNISTISFDKSGYTYHGRVKAFNDGDIKF